MAYVIKVQIENDEPAEKTFVEVANQSTAFPYDEAIRFLAAERDAYVLREHKAAQARALASPSTQEGAASGE